MEKKTTKLLKTRGGKLSHYQKSILQPAKHNVNAKIPGTWGRRSIPIHRYYTHTLPTNAAGHIGILMSPNVIFDSSGGNQSPYWATTAASAYNPGNAIVGVQAQGQEIKPIYNLTALTAKQARLVSLEIKMTSLSTALNRTGTIYGALYPTAAIGYINTLGGVTEGVLMPTVPTIQNLRMKSTSATNGEGVAVSYLPTDEDDLQFLAPNTSDTIRHPNSDDVNLIVIIGQGLQASSTVKIEIAANFEVIPVAESVLAGFETDGPSYPTVPAIEIQQIKQFYGDHLVRRISAYDHGNFGYVDQHDGKESTMKETALAISESIPYVGPVIKAYNTYNKSSNNKKRPPKVAYEDKKINKGSGKNNLKSTKRYHPNSDM
jgi:hypothetical protein